MTLLAVLIKEAIRDRSHTELKCSNLNHNSRLRFLTAFA